MTKPVKIIKVGNSAGVLLSRDMLAKLRVDVAFMGTNGISVEHGFSTPDPAEAARVSVEARVTRSGAPGG